VRPFKKVFGAPADSNRAQQADSGTLFLFENEGRESLALCP